MVQYLPMRPRKNLESVVRAAFKKKHYVPNIVFKSFAEKKDAVLTPGSSRNFVLDLQRSGLMRSAGRGWSTILKTSKFDYSVPVMELADKLGVWFPYAEAKCWSTRQLVNFFHHLPGTFYTYVYIDRSVMGQLRDRLEEHWTNSRVFVNPSATSFLSERKANENFVIRPITRDDEIKGTKMLPIESILVDFAAEAELVIDGWDYGEIVRGVVSVSLIDAHAILRRIARRRFASRNTVTLCDVLFAEGIENDSVRKFYLQLKKKFA